MFNKLLKAIEYRIPQNFTWKTFLKLYKRKLLEDSEVSEANEAAPIASTERTVFMYLVNHVIYDWRRSWNSNPAP